MILSLFSSRPDHPLADAKELKRILAEIPLDNAFKAVDELSGWLESLANANGFRADLLFDVVRQIDDVAQAHLKNWPATISIHRGCRARRKRSCGPRCPGISSAFRCWAGVACNR